jgi:hypothetical protein
MLFIYCYSCLFVARHQCRVLYGLSHFISAVFGIVILSQIHCVEVIIAFQLLHASSALLYSIGTSTRIA